MRKNEINNYYYDYDLLMMATYVSCVDILGDTYCASGPLGVSLARRRYQAISRQRTRSCSQHIHPHTLLFSQLLITNRHTDTIYLFLFLSLGQTTYFCLYQSSSQQLWRAFLISVLYFLVLCTQNYETTLHYYSFVYNLLVTNFFLQNTSSSFHCTLYDTKRQKRDEL